MNVNRFNFDGVEYESAEYYGKFSAGWSVVTGPYLGADGVWWVVMAAPQ